MMIIDKSKSGSWLWIKLQPWRNRWARRWHCCTRFRIMPSQLLPALVQIEPNRSCSRTKKVLINSDFTSFLTLRLCCLCFHNRGTISIIFWIRTIEPCEKPKHHFLCVSSPYRSFLLIQIQCDWHNTQEEASLLHFSLFLFFLFLFLFFRKRRITTLQNDMNIVPPNRKRADSDNRVGDFRAKKKDFQVDPALKSKSDKAVVGCASRPARHHLVTP